MASKGPDLDHQPSSTLTSKPADSTPDISITKAVETYLAEGARAFALKNYQDATEAFSKACEALQSHYGDNHPAMVDAHILYGKALVKHASTLNACLGGGGGGGQSGHEDLDTEPTVNESDVGQAGPSAPSDPPPKNPTGSKPSNKLNPRIHFSGDSSDEEDENGDKHGSDVEESEPYSLEDELEAAFYVLELARVSLEAQLNDPSTDGDKDKLRKKLIQVFELLAEVQQEGEKFEDALESYLSSLEVKKTMSSEECTPRSIAETHLWIGLAYELIPDQSKGNIKAIEHIQQAINLIKSHIDQLEAKRLEAQASTSDKKDSSNGSGQPEDLSDEVKECKSILEDLEAKLEDLKTVPQPAPLDAKELALQAYLQDAILPLKKAGDQTVVNDLSMLVKRKKNTSDLPPAKSASQSETVPDLAEPVTRSVTESTKRVSEEEDDSNQSKRTKLNDHP